MDKPPCPECDQPLEREKFADRLVWYCPRSKCNTIYQSVPVKKRESI